MLLTAIVLLTNMAATAVPTNDSPVPVFTSELDPRVAREIARRQAALCRRAQQARGNPDRLTRGGPVNDEELIDLTLQLTDPQSNCSGDLDAPIALLERRLLPTALRAPNIELLYALEEALRVRNAPDDSARRVELHRVIWVRGGYARISYTLPLWSDDQHREFIARDDIWTWLSEQTGDNFARSQWYGALTDPLSPRHDIAAATDFEEASDNVSLLTRAAMRLLDGGAIPRDTARAERLLIRAARTHEPARLLLVPLVTERMAGMSGAERRGIAEPLRQFAGERTPGGAAARTALVSGLLEDLASAATIEEQQAAAGSLQAFAALGTPAAEAPLLAWTAQHLASTDIRLQRLAFGSISTLLRVGNVGARQVLDAEMARTGGPVERAPLTLADGNLATFITTDDYPSRSLRSEERGTVSAIGVFDPSGRAITVEIVSSSGHEGLDNVVVRSAMRRIRLPASVTNGRFVRAALPLVRFEVPDDEVDASAAPPSGQVLVVRGRRIEWPNLEAPVHGTTISP